MSLDGYDGALQTSRPFLQLLRPSERPLGSELQEEGREEGRKSEIFPPLRRALFPLPDAKSGDWAV